MLHNLIEVEFFLCLIKPLSRVYVTVTNVSPKSMMSIEKR